ncbi:MAG: hypothetical protein Q9157_009089, partial [Trypethelium eluteriae]
MAPDTPSIPIALHKRHLRIERVATLRAEEMANMPLRAARDHDLALDGRMAALAARAEHLMEVQVAVEPQRHAPSTIPHAKVPILHLRRPLLNHLARLPSRNPVQSRRPRAVGLGVEGDAFEALAAMVAREAFRVEALGGGGDDAACDGEGALCALGLGAAGGWGPVRGGRW